MLQRGVDGDTAAHRKSNDDSGFEIERPESGRDVVAVPVCGGGAR
jgi:hypothetical protein